MTRDLRRLHRFAWIVIAPVAAALLILGVLSRRHAVETLRSNVPTANAEKRQ